MPFQKILVALDGSKYSHIAAEYGFWLASSLDATLTGEHVLDPRLVDLFIAPEFAEGLGFGRSVDTAEKVFAALRRIGNVILELFAIEALGRGVKTTTFLSEGHIVDEILKHSIDFDLTIVGHRGHGQSKMPAEAILGSVAEALAGDCDGSVLVTSQPAGDVKQILVAFDGSKPARGALLAAETLARKTGLKLKAIMVITSTEKAKEAQLVVEQGRSYLTERWDEEVFCIKQGHAAATILQFAQNSNSLLVVGAYGFNAPEQRVLGSTAENIIRNTSASILVFKPVAHERHLTNEQRLKEISA